MVDSQAPTLRESFWTWCRVALLSFGGPAGQIAVMHRIIVDEKKWIREDQFLHALNFCVLLPGPEAQQLATYIGWLMHRTAGGLMAGTLFILPGFVSILALSLAYVHFRESPILLGIFFGLKPAVLAIVLQAVFRIGQRVLKSSLLVLLAGAAFIALFVFALPFPMVVIAAGLIGMVVQRFRPDVLKNVKAHGGDDADGSKTAARGGMVRFLTILALGIVLWFGPLVGLLAFTDGENVFVQQHLFFSKAAVVTFGGAYSVLAYVAQQAVERYQWVTPGEMLDGLGLAETTPGPLIMVVEFVAFLGAYRDPNNMPPWLAGTLGAILTTWVTFVPCFLWVFLGAPQVEKLRHNKSLNAALTCITAAVVGVILNLALWFGIHTLFADVRSWTWGPLQLLAPQWPSLQVASAVIAILSAVLLLRLKRSVFEVIAMAVLMGIVLKLTDR